MEKAFDTYCEICDIKKKALTKVWDEYICDVCLQKMEEVLDGTEREQ